MRLRAILVVVILVLTASAVAAEAPPLDVPIYPGGETTMEINMTNEDILPTLKAMLPIVAGKFGNAAQGINVEDIATAFKDLKRIQIAQVDVTKGGVTTNDVAKYYSSNIPKGSWNRVFWQSAGKGTIALYTQGTGESMAIYGFKIDDKMIDGTQTKRVMVVKTDGMVDLAKLLTIAAKYFTGS